MVRIERTGVRAGGSRLLAAIIAAALAGARRRARGASSGTCSRR